MSNLPATSATFAAASKKLKSAPGAGDKAFLKFNGKVGGWTVGRENVNVDGEVILVDAEQLGLGWVRWGESPPAKAYCRLQDAEEAERPAPIDGVDDDGKPKTFHAVEATAFMGRFEEEDLGAFIFESNSMGGVERTKALYTAIIEQFNQTPGDTIAESACYPLVELGQDFWTKGARKVYKPIFTIVGWCTKDGVEVGETKKVEQKPEPEPEPEAEAPRRRRRSRRA